MRTDGLRGGTHVPTVQHHTVQTEGWRPMVGGVSSVRLWALPGSHPFKSVQASPSHCHLFCLSLGPISCLCSVTHFATPPQPTRSLHSPG